MDVNGLLFLSNFADDFIRYTYELLWNRLESCSSHARLLQIGSFDAGNASNYARDQTNGKIAVAKNFLILDIELSKIFFYT